MKKIDLHIHTILSDGTDSPEELLERIARAEIGLFSVTDHDTIKAGIEMPALLADHRAQERPLFLRGVEFSCRDEGGKYHILGYGYDPAVPGIVQVVEKGHALRMKKTVGRLAFLEKEFGITFPEEEIRKLLQRDNPGKPHIANLMVKYGYAGTVQQAISEFINKRQFENVHVSPREAIEGIRRSGGIPVLAHPAYGDGDDLIVGEEMEQRIRYLMEFGLAGLEAFYSGFTPKLVDEMLGFAERYGLYVTAGSDYHGANKMVALGETNLNPTRNMPAGMKWFLEDADIIFNFPSANVIE